MSHLPISLPGFEIEEVSGFESTITIPARATNPTASCPSCGHRATGIHSYYFRSPQDLPSSGLSVHLQLRVRRFRCQNEDCPRQTKARAVAGVSSCLSSADGEADQAPASLLSRFERRSRCPSAGNGWSTNQCRYAVAAGQAQPTPRRENAPSAIGVDDFALRRGKTYGTIIVDLLTHRPLALLKDRTAETLVRWLETHPGVEFISCDRSSEYMRGADEGAPEAQQILDRWHLLKNVREVGKPHCQPGLRHSQAATKRLRSN